MNRWLRSAGRGWMRFAAWLGHQQAIAIYTILYFGLIGPIALARRFGADPLQRRSRGRPSLWLPRPQPPVTLEEARRQ